MNEDERNSRVDRRVFIIKLFLLLFDTTFILKVGTAKIKNLSVQVNTAQVNLILFDFSCTFVNLRIQNET
jgi:hypothetical protein